MFPVTSNCFPPAKVLVLGIVSLLVACSTSLPTTAPSAGSVVVERSAGMTTWATAESLQAEAQAARAAALARAVQPPQTTASLAQLAPAAAGTTQPEVIAQAEAGTPIQRVVYFDFDRDEIRQEFQPMIERRARALLAAGGQRLVLEGHADERGGREYNLSLGQRRAEAVLRSLVLLGVPETQLVAISFGDTRPAVEGSTEVAWSQNRRVEIKAP